MEQLRPLAVELRVDVGPVLDLWEAEASPDGVVVWEAVVPPPHYVEGGEVAAGVLHRAEQLRRWIVNGIYGQNLGFDL